MKSKNERYYKVCLWHSLYELYVAYRKVMYLIDKEMKNHEDTICKYNEKGELVYIYKVDMDYVRKTVKMEYLPYISFERYERLYPNLWKLCSKMYDNHKHKTARVRRRIESMLYEENGKLKDTLWLAITFNEETMKGTTQEERRRLVQRFLKEQTPNYVANIDFGAQKGREHYHCIYGGEYVNTKAWRYGTIDIEHIRRTPEKIATYINKLTYHSVKDSAGYVIYSRNK